MDYNCPTISLYAHSKAVESILHLAEPRFLPPLHFRESLILYTSAKNKAALRMMSMKSPYPSYSRIKDWLNDLSLSPAVQRPLGDIVIAIDNNQILKKKWGIRVENKSYHTVVTMVVAFELDEDGKLQCDPSLAPLTWRQINIAEEDMKKIQTIGADPELRQVHYEKHLSPFVTRRLVKIVNEHEFINGHWTDKVDGKVESDKKKETIKNVQVVNLRTKNQVANVSHVEKVLFQ